MISPGTIWATVEDLIKKPSLKPVYSTAFTKPTISTQPHSNVRGRESWPHLHLGRVLLGPESLLNGSFGLLVRIRDQNRIDPVFGKCLTEILTPRLPRGLDVSNVFVRSRLRCWIYPLSFSRLESVQTRPFNLLYDSPYIFPIWGMRRPAPIRISKVKPMFGG
ncbi:hypothetical protein EJ05DRAFT_511961 [Pseudovirgaria hyperparasitica]|uniref:Uncharacterized protein n=1 Tax=Pseudovirgaria hyperparasitica TaxID=470096 RepID=A0A6A6W836_9PEZI|nr:uncharacterized protein EJ05DRAFT_511961 [Pseudovirgaria hyperparasitica]KAF2757241.1 hypothetical protein EJ05DRAFT_511961 [Pseudovirgaria hyperparasitica]